MADDTLRMRAIMENRISDPMRDIFRQMREFAGLGRRTHEDGERSTLKHHEAYRKLHKAIRDATDQFKQGFIPAVKNTAFDTAEAGVGIATVAAAIAAAGAAAKNFATESVRYMHLAVQTGMGRDAVRMWEETGHRMGITFEDMNASLTEFGKRMDVIQRSPAIAWQKFFPGVEGMDMQAVFREMVNVKGMPREDQFAAVIHRLYQAAPVVGGRQTYEMRERVFEAMGLSPTAAAAFASETEEQILKHQRRIKAIMIAWGNDSQKVGEEAADNWHDLQLQMEEFQVWVGMHFVKTFSDATLAVIGFLKDLGPNVTSAWNAIMAADPKLVSSLNDLKDSALKDWQSIKDAVSGKNVTFNEDLVSTIKWLDSIIKGLDGVTAAQNAFAASMKTFWSTLNNSITEFAVSANKKITDFMAQYSDAWSKFQELQKTPPDANAPALEATPIPWTEFWTTKQKQITDFMAQWNDGWKQFQAKLAGGPTAGIGESVAIPWSDIFASLKEKIIGGMQATPIPWPDIFADIKKWLYPGIAPIGELVTEATNAWKTYLFPLGQSLAQEGTDAWKTYLFPPLQSLAQQIADAWKDYLHPPSPEHLMDPSIEGHAKAAIESQIDIDRAREKAAQESAGAFVGKILGAKPPIVLPELGGMNQFQKMDYRQGADDDEHRRARRMLDDLRRSPANREMNKIIRPGEGPPPSMPGYTPIGFHVTGGQNLRGGMSSGAQDAIDIIAQGTRIGVAEGMQDFYTAMGQSVGGGMMKASLGDFGAGGVGGGGGGHWGGSARGAGAMTPYTGGPANVGGLDPAMVAKIRESAKAHGIDPEVALRVFRSEGGQSTLNYMQPGDNNTSFGPFQLHEGGPGAVGTEYERKTGFNPRDPSHLNDYLNFTFDWVRQHGWGAWQGALKQGITGRMGVGEMGGAGKGVGQWGLNEGFKSKMDAFLAAGEAAGHHAAIISGRRSFEVQSRLYQRYLMGGPLAAPPGHSHHETGNAADLRGDLEWYRQNAHKFHIKPGVEFGDPPHFQDESRLQPGDLTRAAKGAGAMPSGSGKVTGEASLEVKLAGGLAPSGGVKRKGDLFKEVKLARGAVPYANTEA